MEKVTVDRLIEVLDQVKAEFGGNCEVKMFCGGDYSDPVSAELDDCTSELMDVMVQDSKFLSFMNGKNRFGLDKEIVVWFKYV